MIISGVRREDKSRGALSLSLLEKFNQLYSRGSHAHDTHPSSRPRCDPAVLLSLTGILCDPSKLRFIANERSCGLAIPNKFTRDYERMTIFGHYSIHNASTDHLRNP